MSRPKAALTRPAAAAVPKLSRYALSARGEKPTATKSCQPMPADFTKIVASGTSTISVSQARVNPKVRPKPGMTEGRRQWRRRSLGGDIGGGLLECEGTGWIN